MEFVENKGQFNNKVHYSSNFNTGAFFLEKNGFTVLLHKDEDVVKLSEFTHGHKRDGNNKSKLPLDTFTLHSFAYNVSFLGANMAAKNVPDKQLQSYNNYFIGSDKNKWATHCNIFGAITYNNIYPNIDIRYYSSGSQLKYDFIVRPGGNPNQIAMRYDGAVKLSTKNKSLVIETSVGTVTELPPYAYVTAGVKSSTAVETNYSIRDNVVSFNVADYDTKQTLIIDPAIIFSTLTGSRTDNWGYTATPGPDGSFFAGGIAFGNGYPVSMGAFQTQFNGGSAGGVGSGVDMAIFKFSANGSQRLYATYLGGSGDEQPHSMITDASGNLIIAGRSNSLNYPLLTSIPSTGAKFDIVVTKLNAAGTALLGSVKIGGSEDDGVNIRPKFVSPSGSDRLRRNYGDDARSEVILDAQNNIVVASATQSNNFPIFLAAQPSFGGVQDGVILKFTPNLNSLLFSTYFGGSGDDACFVAAINPITGNLYVAGATSSNNLLGNTSGTIGANFKGDIDGFVTQLQPNGAAFIRTTYLGTTGIDLVYGLKFDKGGFPYVMGTTTGSWPIVNALYQNAGAKQFIAKMQPDLSAYVFSTVFGKNGTDPSISPIAFLVDRCENVYVSGWGGGINVQENYSTGNTMGLPEVNPLTNIPAADGRDFYFFVLKKDAQSQLFGSHYGEFGGLGDHVDGGTSRFDANGIIYQAICANCSGRDYTPPVVFPTTGGSWSQSNGSNGCNEAALKIDMNFSGVGAEIQSTIGSVVNDSIGCIPLVVNFKDLQRKGVTYYWNFNSTANPTVNDTTTTTPEVNHTFTTVGTYIVRLISEDLNTCNLRDTSYITINASNNRIFPKFSKRKIEPCTSSTFEFTNETTTANNNVAYTNQTFVWNYGDGSPNDTANITPNRLHTFPGPGTYIVKLFVIDGRFCNAPDSIVDTIRLNPLVKAIPSTNNIGCAPYTAIFKNNSLGGLTWKWEFGDPASGILNESTSFEPTHLYQNVGMYQYRLIAFDSTTCNKADTSAYFPINVVPKPTAAFTWGPNPPQINIPVRFTNNSLNANRYLWYFGDGDSSIITAPTHEYVATGSYNAILVAYNNVGCSDTARDVVQVIINPLLDVPNAFTPDKFGENAFVTVKGFGIAKMDWKIYNRWGQLIFRSNSKKVGWNGYYKNKLQPTDVYTYTLDVEFSDGKKLRKTGDITLLR